MRIKIEKVGIAMAVYSPPVQVFFEQLESIQKQTFKNWVCILTLDSPLSDLKKELILAPFFEDSRFIWSENKDRLGHKKNFEKAMVLALNYNVDAIACSDQDDVWYPEKLEVCIQELEKRGPLSLVHSDMHVLRSDRIETRSTWDVEKRGVRFVKPSHFYVRNVVAGCAMLLDAELVRKFPFIPDGAEYHDHWYALIASYYGGVYPIFQPLFAYRQHGNNAVGVTPFVNIFHLEKKLSRVEILKKCRKGWLKSFRLIDATVQAKLPVSFLEKMIFYYHFDFGLSVFLLGLVHWFKDPPFARACLARATGKTCFFLNNKT